MSPRVRLCRSGSLEREAEEILITVTGSGPVGEFVLLVSAMLTFVSLKVLVPQGNPLEDTAKALLNYDLWPPPGHSGVPENRDQQVRRRLLSWQELTHPNHEEEVLLLFHIMGREKYVRHPDCLFGYLSVLVCLILMVNGRVQGN